MKIILCQYAQGEWGWGGWVCNWCQDGTHTEKVEGVRNIPIQKEVEDAMKIPIQKEVEENEATFVKVKSKTKLTSQYVVKTRTQTAGQDKNRQNQGMPAKL